MKSRLLFYSVLVPLLLLFIVIGFFTYRALNDYRASHSNIKYLSQLRETDRLAGALLDEEFYSNLFMGSTTDGEHNLRQSRRTVDRILHQMHQNADFDRRQQALFDKIEKDLVFVRNSVDTLSKDYAAVMEKGFDEGIFTPLIALSRSLGNGLSSEKLRGISNLETSFLESRIYFNHEKSFFGYLMLKQVAADAEILKIWEKILAKEYLPDPDIINDPLYSDRLHRLIEDEKIWEPLKLLRGEVVDHLSDGRYEVTIPTLQNRYFPIEKSLSRGMKILDKGRDSGGEEALEAAKNDLYKYGIALFFILLVLLVYLRSFSNAYREKKALEEALRDLVRDLDESHRNELEKFLRRGDRKAIYRFLADITREAYEAREQALAAEKAKDLFLANMSHELRTPLNGIIGFAQLLASTELQGDQKEFLEIIENSSNGLLKIVNNILDLSKIRSNKIEFESIEFSIIETLEDTVEPYETLAGEKNVRYTTFIDPTLPRLLGDPTKLRQVLTNLIGNALKFTPKGGEVDIVVEKRSEEEGKVRIDFTVQDTGIGISKEQQEHIFEAFAQADDSTTRKYGGTGLGLAITKELVEKMGGELQLDSEEGKGSKFYFTLTLPIAGEDTEHQASFPDRKVVYFHPAGERHTLREKFLRRYLDAMDIEFEESKSFDAALSKGADLVMMDYSFAEVRNKIAKLDDRIHPILLFGNLSRKNEHSVLRKKVRRIVYHPILYSKLIKALREIFSEKIEDLVNKQGEGAIPTVSLKGMKILVAEDNPINRKLIVNLLERFGIDVDVVENGQEALRERRSNDYDLIFMDIQMPVLGGIEATREILKYEEEKGIRHIPIVALTANALQGDREKYLAAGMDEYISKPIDPEKLRHILEMFAPESSAESKTVQSASKEGEESKLNASESKQESEETLGEADDQNLAEEREQAEENSSDVTETFSAEEHTEEEISYDTHEVTQRDILYFGPSGALQTLHGKLSEARGYILDTVKDEKGFESLLEKHLYRCIFVDSRKLTQELCEILAGLSDLNVPIYLYDAGSKAECASAYPRYASIQELKKIFEEI